MGVAGSVVILLKADSKEFERRMKRAERRLRKFSRNANRLGDSLTRGLTLPLVGLTLAAGKMSIDINEAMANVATLIPGQIDRVRELKKGVQDLAAATGEDSGGLAAALYDQISAMGDSADTLDRLTTATKFAVGGVAETADAIRVLNMATKAYGNTTKENAKHFADVMQMTVRLGVTNLPALAKSMGKVIPLAVKQKVSFEELAGVYATLTGVTGDTAEVSTQIAAILRAEIKPTADMARAIASLGFETAEAMNESLGFVNALRALIGTTDGTATGIGKLFGRVEGLTAVFALNSTLAEEAANKIAAMNGELDTSAEAFHEQMNGINKTGRQLKQWKEEVKNAAAQLGDELIPKLIELSKELVPVKDSLVTILDVFLKMPDALQSTTVKVALLAVALGPLIRLVGALGMGLIALAGAVSWPVALAIVIGGIAAGLLGWRLAAQGAKEATEELGETVKDLPTTVIKGEMPDIPWQGPIQQDAVKVTNQIKKWAQGLDDLEGAIQGWGEMWADTLSQAIVNGNLLKVKFHEMIESMIADLIRLALMKEIFQPAVSGIQNWLGIPLTGPAATATGTTIQGGYGGGMPPITIINNSSAQVSAQPAGASQGGGVQIIVEEVVNSSIATGAFDRSLGGRFGLAAQGIGR